MASRSISAILWTLVSVNVITLVVGGLITWLGYAIPVRLKQFGLLPELVIVAGFASLIVACIGLCALNYSSHYALNIYGFSCTVFVMMLVFGIPETWYKSHQFVTGGLLMDIIYFSLVIMLIILLAFAFTFAQYLRRKEMAQNLESGLRSAGSDCNSPNCLCQFQHHYSGLATAAAAAAETDANDRNQRNNSSFIDRWLPWTNHSHNNNSNNNNNNNNNRNNNNNIADEINLASRNNVACHCHCRTSPLQQAPRNQFGSRCQICNNNYHKPANSSHNATSPYPLQPLPPLIHKGFYRSCANTTTTTTTPNGENMMNTGSSLVRAKSFNQPLNEEQQQQQQQHQEDDFYDKSQMTQRASAAGADCRWMNRIYRSSSSNQCLTQTGSRDDSLVQYGRGHFLAQIQQQHYQMPMNSDFPTTTLNRGHHHHHHHHTNNIRHHNNNNLSSTNQLNSRSQYNVSKCNCHLGSGQNITASTLAYRRYFNDGFASNTMPTRLNSSAYATKFKPNKIRAKGSSSVVAMTAAAAAALLGGVADTCSARPNESDGLFSGAGDGILGGDGGGGDADISFMDRCILDNNNHQLNVSMLNDTSNIHHSGCHQPVLDFAPLLDFRKS